MAVALIVVAHDGIGPALVGTAEFVLGRLPVNVRALSVSRDSEPEEIIDRLRAAAAELDDGDGVLVLTDLYGATPTNVARTLLDGRRARVITGINLPMLLNVLNYPDQSLERLAELALAGGRDGIVAAGND